MADITTRNPAGSRQPSVLGDGWKRGGNDAPWKAWKTPKTSFPPFPLGLEIRPKPPDSHISTAPTAGLILKEGEKKI